MIDRSKEHIDKSGRLRVPLAKSTDKAPFRKGWEPFFVNINLDHPVQKVVSYRRVG